MVATALSLICVVVLLVTRSRLERAERRLRELDLTLTKLQGELTDQAKRLAQLSLAADGSQHVLAHDQQPSAAGVAVPLPAATAQAPRTPAIPSPTSAESVRSSLRDHTAESDSSYTPPTAARASAHLPPSAADPGAGTDPFERAINAARELLFGGNTVVRVGIIVLLVGVTLLLRWASEHSLFPIELRLAGVAVGAMALIGFGFSKRESRRGFSLTLQGGGIAALYLVVFFAFRSYGLVPAPAAFALLCAISLCSGVLSVQQDSRALLFIAQLFGFAAPILASTNQGSHIALFSYYLLLNLLTFTVALYKAWRAVNLLGFVFTFGVATSWGVLRYEPGLFASTEPFLLAFFAVYVAIPVLFALRHPHTPQGWVDGSLVFGTPLATLGLQWALVHDRPFGMAFSSVGLAAVYLCLAAWLRRVAAERLRALTEAFLPIGVGFTTLAIPYALDDHNLTAAAWAIEGAGLYWVGVRQERRLSRAAGVVLQLLAGAARQSQLSSAQLSGALSGVLIGLSALFIAYYAYARRYQLQDLEWRGLQLLIVWGVPFVAIATWQQIARSAPAELAPGVRLATCAALALSLETLAHRGQWLPGRFPALLLWPLMAAALLRYIFDWDEPPLTRGGFFGWPALALTMYVVLRRFVDSFSSTYPALVHAHATALWLWAAWLMALCKALLRPPLQLDVSYGAGAATLVLALLGLGVVLQAQRGGWPAGTHAAHYLRVGMVGLLIAGALWTAGMNLGLAADVSPLPYLPLLNPIELPTLIGALVALSWRKLLRHSAPPSTTAPATKRSLIALCAVLFCSWNALLARAVHHYGGVPFDWDLLLRSSALQLALSLSWTAIALVIMWLAHRRAVRGAWIAAAVLLGGVVCKLFLLDLEHLSAPTKIASFMGVGALLLIIGYLAPVPPRAQTTAKPMEVQP